MRSTSQTSIGTAKAVARKNLALNLYNSRKSALANEWLATRERDASGVVEAELRAIARSDNEANWAAANAARRANTISMIALGVAGLALIVAGLGVWK